MTCIQWYLVNKNNLFLLFRSLPSTCWIKATKFLIHATSSLSQISLVLVCQLLYLVVANIYLIELVKHPLFLIGVIHHQTLIVWQSLLIHSSLKVILVLFIVHKVVSLPSDSPLRHPQSKFLSLGKVGRQIRLTSKLWWGRGLKNLIVSVNLSAIGS